MAVTLQFRLRGRSQTLTLDATLSTGHTSKVAITKHPVETGAKIADNVRPDEETVQVEGLISDTPLSFASVERFPRDLRTRTNQAVLVLYGLQESAVLCTVITDRRVYRNMILRDLSIPEEHGEQVKFSGTFERVRFATTKQVLNPAVNRGKDKVEGGSKPTQTAPKPVQVKASWWYSAGEAIDIQKWFTPSGG